MFASSASFNSARVTMWSGISPSDSSGSSGVAPSGNPSSKVIRHRPEQRRSLQQHLSQLFEPVFLFFLSRALVFHSHRVVHLARHEARDLRGTALQCFLKRPDGQNDVVQLASKRTRRVTKRGERYRAIDLSPLHRGDRLLGNMEPFAQILLSHPQCIPQQAQPTTTRGLEQGRDLADFRETVVQLLPAKTGDLARHGCNRLKKIWLQTT